MAYTFYFRSSYMDVATYEIHGDGLPYRVRVRRNQPGRGTKDTPRYSPPVPEIGSMIRSALPFVSIPPQVVQAFNDWRMSEYVKLRTTIAMNHETYKSVDWSQPEYAPPEPVKAAFAAYARDDESRTRFMFWIYTTGGAT